MAFIYIFCSSLCSLLIAHLLKYTRTTPLKTLHVLTINYLAATLLVLMIKFDLVINMEWMKGSTILFALIVGIIFILNFFIYSASVDQNGVGVSIAAMRLSLFVPVLLSVIYYREALTGLKIMGVVAVFIALLLLIPNLRKISFSKYNAAMLIPLLFLLSGMGDASLKIFEEELTNKLNETLFMGMVFCCAFLAGSGYILMTGQRFFTGREVIVGTAIGIPNLYSSIFLLWGLPLIDGATAFSFVNVLNVTGGTLLGIIYWKDRLNRKQMWGITTALAAILLLIIKPN